jgi:PhnB protein
MSEQSPIERLDEAVDALLAGRSTPTGLDAEVAELVALAILLRGMPTERFKTALRADLERRASMTTAADSISRPPAAPTRVPPAAAAEGFTTLTPYLVVQRPEDLVEFVKRAFGAEERYRTTGSAGGLHTHVRIGDSMLMVGGMAGVEENPTSLHLYVEDADAVYERALAAGASSLQGPTEQPYGDREAGVKDAFGNEWFIATHTAAGPGRHRPEGLRAVTPYLHPRGAGELIEFLKRALGAEEIARHASPDGVIHHAEVRLGDSILEMGEAHGPWQPMPTMFYLYVEDVDASYERALREGAESVAPPRDQPYGDRSAGVKDPTGNLWYLAAPVKRGA